MTIHLKFLAALRLVLFHSLLHTLGHYRIISFGRVQVCASIAGKSETTRFLLRVVTKPKVVVLWSIPSSKMCQLGHIDIPVLSDDNFFPPEGT